MLNGIQRVLLVRTDKIGDVVLTTPAIAALRKKLPEARFVGLTSRLGRAIYEANPHLNATLVFDSEHFSGLDGFFRLVAALRREKFDAAVVFQTRLPVALAILFAGIRFRIGPLSKWWSWLTYNLGRRQNRSAVEMHEADYNIQLLREFGITVADTWEKTYLQVSKEAKIEALKFFREKGFTSRYKTVVIHPGMAGSALNWPESHYINLGRRLSKKYHILITGGPSEAPLVERVYQGIARNQSFSPDQPVFAKYIGEGSLEELCAILDTADAVVAPSTGPMHLAVALGKKVLSVFSPIKVQSAVRWGPYGISVGTNLGVAPEDKASVLVPDVNCAENFKCALSACIYYPCMPRIAVEDLEIQLTALLEGSSVSMFKSSSFVGYDVEDSFDGDEE